VRGGACGRFIQQLWALLRAVCQRVCMCVVCDSAVGAGSGWGAWERALVWVESLWIGCSTARRLGILYIGVSLFIRLSF